jgi:penicillin amidase
VAWIGTSAGAGRSISTWLELVDAESVPAAMQQVRHCPLPSLVWIFADREGRIGKQASGWFPRRPKHLSGLLPVPAWDPLNHWQGRHDPQRLPGELDPPCGYTLAANEEVRTPGGPQWVTQIVPDYRFRRILERLGETPRASLEEMQRLQYDVLSVHARELLTIFLPLLSDGPMKERLSLWDCRYSPESREATLFQHFYRNLLLEVFGHEKGIGWRRMLYLCTRVGFSTMVLTAIDRLLKHEQSLWWHDRDKKELARRAAERAALEKDEPWSRFNCFHFANRFFEGRRVGNVLGFHTSEMAMPGCHATPFQGHLLKTATRETSFAPSYHFVTDLGTRQAWTNLPGGPSESPFSKYYKNDISRWADGKFKCLDADAPLP